LPFFRVFRGALTCRYLGEQFSSVNLAEDVATQVIDQIEDPTTQSNLMTASAILAGLRLEQEVIYQLVRRDIMQESVIYRSILKDERQTIALNLLRGGVDINLITSSTGLPLEEVEKLRQQIIEA
jgi:predicted transposase YdaD